MNMPNMRPRSHDLQVVWGDWQEMGVWTLWCSASDLSISWWLQAFCGSCRVVKMLVLGQVMWIAFPSRSQGAQGSAMQDLHELQGKWLHFLWELRYRICSLRSGVMSHFFQSCPTALLSARHGWIWPVVMPGKWGKGDATMPFAVSVNQETHRTAWTSSAFRRFSGHLIYLQYVTTKRQVTIQCHQPWCWCSWWVSMPRCWEVTNTMGMSKLVESYIPNTQTMVFFSMFSVLPLLLFETI